MKPCCANCAFLCKLQYKDSVELTTEERNALNKTSHLSCYKAQIPAEQGNEAWKHGQIKESIENLNKNKCDFYLPYNSCTGLTFDAIEQKQIRSIEIENSITSKRMLTISKIGLWVSGGAVIIALISLFS